MGELFLKLVNLSIGAGWLVLAVVLFYSLVSYALLRRRMSTATLYRKNIRQSEQVASPFVLGLFRPVIYLPYRIAEADMEHVITHEQAHIQRKDHWWKPVGFIILSVYWFHPLLWLAYVLLCRDIEAACDERVIKKLEIEERTMNLTKKSGDYLIPNIIPNPEPEEVCA